MTNIDLYEQAIQAFNIKEDENIWVFGYGSLMWNPEFPYLQSIPAHLCGYHRRFCLSSNHHRGTEEAPGLVLGLDRGGSCRGIAFEIDHYHLKEVLPVLWSREMHGTLSFYKAKSVPILARGNMQEKISACTFIADRNHEYYFDNHCRDTAVEMIYNASGIRGSNLEYLQNTASSMRELGIYDPLLEDLLKRVESYSNKDS